MVKTEAHDLATCPTPFLVSPYCGEMRTRPVHGAFRASFLGCRVGKREEDRRHFPSGPLESPAKGSQTQQRR